MTEATMVTPAEPHQDAIPGRPGPAAAVTLSLVALGDFLTFGQTPGINLFVLAVTTAAAIAGNRIGRLPIQMLLIAFASCVTTALPLIEAPGLLATLLAACGLSVQGLFSARLFPAQPTALPLTLFRFASLAPLRLLLDVTASVGHGIGLKVARRLVVWTVPAVLTLVFIALFWSANTVVADVLGRFDASALSSLLDPWRLGLWLAIAAAAWALLRPRLMNWPTPTAPAATVAVAPENLLFGRAAILRSLLVFNALFAVQTSLDLTYLWGGASLPDGLTHADYAHRSAYPLIVTALLAAAFVLAAMRRDGPAQGSPLIRGLVYAWIAQNILLCISSILRLELYVEAYSLTEWRVAAGIWMALVAAGLGLILLRILFQRSNEWLVAMNLATLALTLYACALVDFSAVIADFNVAHSYRLTGIGRDPDLGYLRALGPSALPALDRYIAAAGHCPGKPNDSAARQVRQQLAVGFADRSADWRSWSFRDWRLARYLRSEPAIASAATSDGCQATLCGSTCGD